MNTQVGLPDVSANKLASSGESAIALKRLQRNQQRSLRQSRITSNAVINSQMPFGSIGSKFTQGTDSNTFNQQLNDGKDFGASQKDQVMQWAGNSNLTDCTNNNNKTSKQWRQSNRKSKGKYKLQQSLDNSFTRQRSYINEADGKQISKISNLIDQHQSMRMMQPSLQRDLLSPPHNTDQSISGLHMRSQSRYVPNINAVAAFEKSKFQSYTNLDANTQSLKMNRGNTHTDNNLNFLRDNDIQKHDNDSIEQTEQFNQYNSLHLNQVKNQQFVDQIEEIPSSRSQHNIKTPKQNKHDKLFNNLSNVAPNQSSNNHYQESITWNTQQSIEQSAFKIKISQENRQLSTGRQKLQKLPLITPSTPFAPVTMTKRCNQRQSVGRSLLIRDSITTPLQNSKILIKQAANKNIVHGDYGGVQQRLPELARSMANGYFRQKSTQNQLNNSSNAPNSLIRTPREPKLGVLQQAVWQRVQQINQQSSGVSQHQKQFDISSSQPTHKVNQPNAISNNFVDDTTVDPYSQGTAYINHDKGKQKGFVHSLESATYTPQNNSRFQRSVQQDFDLSQLSYPIKQDQIQQEYLTSKLQTSQDKQDHNVDQDQLQNKQDEPFEMSSKFDDVNQQNAVVSSDLTNISEGQSIVNTLGGKLLQTFKNKKKNDDTQDKANDQANKIDPITGLNLNQYLMKQGFNKMLKLLEVIRIERKANDQIEKSLSDVASECKLDLSEQGLQQLVDDMKKLVARRVRRKREEERGLAGYIQDDCCQIALKSQKFLNSTQYPPTHNAFDQMIYEAAKSNLPTECSHHRGEEDIEQECISLYKKLLLFRSHLQLQLSQELPKDRLVRGILEHIQEDTREDYDNLKFFKDEKNVLELLNNPFMAIIEPEEVRQKEKAVLDQGSPQKQMNQQKVISHRLGNVIYETKNQQTVSLSAKQTIHEVQIQIEKDNELMIQQQDMQATESDENDEERLANKALEERRKKARKLLMAGVKTRDTNRNNNKKLIDMQELISDNLERDNQLIAHDPLSDESAQISERIAIQKLPNAHISYRLNLLNKMQEQDIQNSLKVSQVKHRRLNYDDIDEDDITNRKHRLGGYDEAFSSKKNEYIDASEAYWKIMRQMDHLIKIRQPLPGQQSPNANENKTTINAQPGQSFDVASTKSYDQDESNYQQNLLNNLEAGQKFYVKAKHEVHGNNQPATLESQFYVNCQANRLLAYPIFKCVKNNTMNFHGQPLNIGYCKAFAQMIKNNVEACDHLLSIHLDDCNMKDEEFATILDSIMQSKYFYTSIQSIKYSNNEIGHSSVQKLEQLMSLDHDIPQFKQEVYCLKELVLSNVSFRRVNDLRSFIQMLAGPSSQNLQKLKLHNINLNQGDHLTQQEMLTNICELIENTPKLRSLSLSQCNLGAKSLFKDESDKLVLNTWFLKIFDSLLLNQSHLSTLDLSGNPISLQSTSGTETLSLIIDKIQQLIEEKISLSSLNLSGLKLTSAINKVIPSLKKNNTLCYLNLSNNGLLPYDQEYIFKELTIPMMTDAESVQSQQVFINEDACFKKAFNSFKTNHLRDLYIQIMTKQNKQGSQQDGYQSQENEDSNQAEYELYASMVNSAIMKRVQEQNNLARKVAYSSQISGEKLQRVTILGEKSDIDQIVLHREARNPELIFNTLHTSAKRGGQFTPSLESYDFRKPWSWQYISQEMERDSNTNSWQESECAQYVSICLNSKNIEEYFSLVKDDYIIKLIKKNYGLDHLHKANKDLEENSQIRNGFLVFGSLTDWKAHQMLKVYKVTSALVATTEKEHKALEHDVFDEVNNVLKQTFKTLQSTIWTVYQTLLKNENAQVVGMTDPEFQSYSQQHKDDLIQKYCFTYCSLVRRPGKHSIFIYDIENDEIYFKTLIIEQSLPWAFAQGRWSPIYQSITQQPLESASVSPQTHTAIQRLDFQHPSEEKNLEIPFKQSTRQENLKHAFINDISPCNLAISQYFTKEEDLQKAFDDLYGRYDKIVALYQELISNSPEDHPRLSLEAITSFVKERQLLSKLKSKEDIKAAILTTVLAQLPSSMNKQAVQKQAYPLDLSYFDKADRAKFIGLLYWLWKQNHKHQHWPCNFDQYLDQFILQDTEKHDYWTIKDQIKQDADVQDFLRANTESLLEFLRLSSHFRGFYVGFSVDIANQILINGELEANKKDPPKASDGKKKKGKKGAKKEPEVPQPKKPAPEMIPIKQKDMQKCFFQSLQMLVMEQSETDGMQGHIKSLDELNEFLYRVSQHVYDPSSYEEHIPVPKTISSLFEATSVQKLTKVMTVVFKIVGMSVTINESD